MEISSFNHAINILKSFKQFFSQINNGIQEYNELKRWLEIAQSNWEMDQQTINSLKKRIETLEYELKNTTNNVNMQDGKENTIIFQQPDDVDFETLVQELTKDEIAILHIFGSEDNFILSDNILENKFQSTKINYSLAMENLNNKNIVVFSHGGGYLEDMKIYYELTYIGKSIISKI